MIKSIRSPLGDGDSEVKLATVCPVDKMADALGELEAMAWLRDNQTAAMLIGAARLALRDP
jgi:hypothetical protein